MKTNIGITEENRQAVVDALSIILADEYVLYTKTRNAHWNVEGPDFYDKHKFFETQYEELAERIDNIAERIRSLGHYAPATLKEFLALTHLTEREQNDNSSTGFIKELLQDHETICIHLREIIIPLADTYKDLGTSDFITALLEEHEKTAWFLRAHLK
ncbi:DNA starvation/stationary phase protection protein [Maribacter sp. MMG018]|uniref:Dps family protein n=1 Tax=Maribacter sp. MMG018 TaxID=2822688 RepID=UPI001B396AB9|nr:DNA starvation/stationary phase protection protein [Maribacter sp. MMG018]MBQ4915077.1 DNA starvation/stationary phase protection protein [Maribacter sp. MMG018]